MKSKSFVLITYKVCLHRLTFQIIRESGNTQTADRPFYDYLEGCLRHKAEMVIFEAARAITELNGVTSRELTPAITVLQLFLSSSKPVLRFAAVRTLNKVISFNYGARYASVPYNTFIIFCLPWSGPLVK